MRNCQNAFQRDLFGYLLLELPIYFLAIVHFIFHRDLTHTGKHAEVIFGVELTKEITDILGGMGDDILLISGNHDVDGHSMSKAILSRIYS